MTDLKTQIRDYYEATTNPVDVDPISVLPGTVLVGPFPDDGRQRRVPRGWSGPRVAALAFVAVAITALVAAAIGLVARQAEPDPASVETETRAVLEGSIAAANAHDLEALMAFYAEDAVVIGHPIDPSRTEGRDAIRELERAGLELQAAENANQLTDVVVSGHTVTFGLIFWNEHRVCYSGQGHRVFVEDGLIIIWDWARLNDPCDLPSVSKEGG